ncbi:MAG: pimeloyl-ACP methyl ester carboxylesterase [Flavobacterium sp.]|jgi:pimeloyl-ACP methyl ester carboxylesterase
MVKVVVCVGGYSWIGILDFMFSCQGAFAHLPHDEYPQKPRRRLSNEAFRAELLLDCFCITTLVNHMKLLKIAASLISILLLSGMVYFYKGDLPIDYVDEKYSNVESQFLYMSNGARVHYRDEGDATKPVVVLVHGSNASLHTWEPWVAALSKGYRVISMDLPGHGLTGATPDQDYSSQAQLNTVDAVVSHLKVESFVLGGNSMGGGVTWRYTLEHPEKVQAMLLVDSSGLPQFRRKADDSAQETKARPLIFTLMRKPWFRSVAQYIDPYLLTVQGVKSAYNNSLVVTDELIDRYYELGIRQGSRAATISRFSGFDTRRQESVDLTQLNMPTLIMWGKEDALIPVSVADQFAAVLEKGTLVIYEDVGHAPMEEIPERSAADVILFLESIGI